MFCHQKNLSHSIFFLSIVTIPLSFGWKWTILEYFHPSSHLNQCWLAFLPCLTYYEIWKVNLHSFLDAYCGLCLFLSHRPQNLGDKQIQHGIIDHLSSSSSKSLSVLTTPFPLNCTVPLWTRRLPFKWHSDCVPLWCSWPAPPPLSPTFHWLAASLTVPVLGTVNTNCSFVIQVFRPETQQLFYLSSYLMLCFVFGLCKLSSSSFLLDFLNETTFHHLNGPPGQSQHPLS